ncbi:MAG: hypothetical protein WC277_12825 [Bacilli bacterium]|jgi:hypothetical protein
MTSTKLKFDALIEGIMTRISGAKDTIDIETVREGDELPAYLETNSIYVIPLIEGRDQIKTHMGDDEVVVHEFPVQVVGYYRYTGRTAISDGLRPVRGYGFDVIDLFTPGVSGALATSVTEGAVEPDEFGDGGDPGTTTDVACFFTDPSLESGYMRITDYVIHYFIVTLNVKAAL